MLHEPVEQIDMNKSGWKIQQRQAKVSIRAIPKPKSPRNVSNVTLDDSPWKKGHLLGSQRDELWSLVLSSFTPNFSFKVSTWYSNHQILKH